MSFSSAVLDSSDMLRQVLHLQDNCQPARTGIFRLEQEPEAKRSKVSPSGKLGGSAVCLRARHRTNNH
eukprot:3233965-Rhodomonas_salina.2